MKDKIEIVLFSLFGLWVLLIPAIFIMKIKYFKTLRRKEFKGIEELFLILNSEWWMAGFTWLFPIFGKERNVELKAMKTKANSRLCLLYTIMMIQLVLFGLLNNFAA
jgi:hypothetical protein